MRAGGKSLGGPPRTLRVGGSALRLLMVGRLTEASLTLRRRGWERRPLGWGRVMSLGRPGRPGLVRALKVAAAVLLLWQLELP